MKHLKHILNITNEIYQQFAKLLKKLNLFCMYAFDDNY